MKPVRTYAGTARGLECTVTRAQDRRDDLPAKAGIAPARNDIDALQVA